jgi:hypothetical protein
VRDGVMGNGAARVGNARWRRLTEERAGSAKSVFHFDVQGSVAKSTHFPGCGSSAGALATASISGRSTDGTSPPIVRPSPRSIRRCGAAGGPNKTVEICAMMSARVRMAQGINPMVLRQIAISAGALVVAIAVQGNSANALSMQECSAKYNAAKEAGTLGGMKWNDFRKAQCGADAAAAPTSTTPPAPAA